MTLPTIGSVDLGDSVAVTVRIRSTRSNVLTDATVTASAAQGGSTVTATIERIQTGVYEAVFTPTAAGDWLFTANISGARLAVEYGIVKVRPVPTVP
jgi:hypothetical protein